MPDGRITKYIPGRGSVVVGFKAPDANVNFIYSPVKGLCPVTFGQSKQAKQLVSVAQCPCIVLICITYSGGSILSEFTTILDDSFEGKALDGGNASTNVCG
jgi:hypothetical protein